MSRRPGDMAWPACPAAGPAPLSSTPLLLRRIQVGVPVEAEHAHLPAGLLVPAQPGHSAAHCRPLSPRPAHQLWHLSGGNDRRCVVRRPGTRWARTVARGHGGPSAAAPSAATHASRCRTGTLRRRRRSVGKARPGRPGRGAGPACWLIGHTQASACHGSAAVQPPEGHLVQQEPQGGGHGYRYQRPDQYVRPGW